MKNQGVTGVYKFTKPDVDGKSRIPSGKIILTFDLYRLPSSVDVAWYKCKVDHYIPNPMRCNNCQKLGHTKNRCSGNSTCPTCSLPPHDPEKCVRTLCTNCSGEHSSADKNCPRYIQMKEILKIKTKNYCSLGEARRKYKEYNPISTTSNKNSYSSTVSNTTSHQKNFSNKQTNANSNTSAATNIIPKNNPTQTSTHSNITTSTKNLQTKTNEITQLNISKSNNLNSHQVIAPAENNNIKRNNTTTNKLMSPISNLTQSLIASNNYFTSNIHEEDSDEMSTEPSPTRPPY